MGCWTLWWCDILTALLWLDLKLLQIHDFFLNIYHADPSVLLIIFA